MTTTPARTAFDIARSTDWDHAVSVVDSALRLRLCTPADLVTVLARYARTPSASRVTRIFEFADGRAESVGESICRLRIAQLGLPAPELQTVLKLAPGSPEARVDFDFPGYRTVAEFDGKVKYGRLLKVEQAAGDVVFGEKVREDRIRDTGRQMVRLTWSDLGQPEQLRHRFDAAFRRAGFPDWQREPPRFHVTGRVV